MSRFSNATDMRQIDCLTKIYQESKMLNSGATYAENGGF